MLNAAQQRFAEELAKGASNEEAYKTAFPKSKYPRQDSGRLMSEGNPTKPDIEAEILRIRQKAQEMKGGAVLTLAEKREFLAAVVRTPIGEIDEMSPLCQSYKRSRKVVGRGEEAEEWETDEVKAISKTDAIKIDNEMSGDNAAVKHDVVVEDKGEWLRRIRGRKDDNAPDA